MKSKVFLIIFNFILLIIQSWGKNCILQSEGTYQRGVCVNLSQCQYGLRLLWERKSKLTLCDSSGNTVIICCPEEKFPGERARKKCIEYNIGNDRIIKGNLIYNGQKSLAREFPHMALLGVKNKEAIIWGCGGSLISDKYVLTAAHCFFHREYGILKIVRLGELDTQSDTDLARPEDYSISQFIQYPTYDVSSYYHDIGLIKLNRTVRFNNFINPACLYYQKTIPYKYGIITGWGQKSFLGEKSSFLLKANVTFQKHEDCKRYFPGRNRKLRNGIQNDIQFCAGDTSGTDTCSGDSGGPIQIKIFDPKYHVPYYIIVGITSFGRPCGFENSMGVYVKVAPYIPWIENIVF